MTNLKLVPELYCSDIDITKRFYLEVFGFEIKYERPEEKFIRFTLDGIDIMVECISAEGRHWITGELMQPFGRGINFQWEVFELEEIYTRVKNKAPESIYLEMETKSYRCGDDISVQKQFIAQDPDGYLFRFCSGRNEIT